MRPTLRAHEPRGIARGPRRDQRGFSLVIVFLIIIVMVGIAAGVMVTTQGDVQVSGAAREAKVAFYAAQAGLAQAEDYLLVKSGGGGSWTQFLASGDPKLCGPINTGQPIGPPRCPTAQNPVDNTFDPSRQAGVRYCIHNNAIDPRYVDNGVSGSGDLNDGDNIITVESWGYGANNAMAHLVMDVRFPAGTQRRFSYAQQGGSEVKQNASHDGNNLSAASSFNSAYGQ